MPATVEIEVNGKKITTTLTDIPVGAATEYVFLARTLTGTKTYRTGMVLLHAKNR